MITELKYGQTWKICPSPLSLSLYNPFPLDLPKIESPAGVPNILLERGNNPEKVGVM